MITHKNFLKASLCFALISLVISFSVAHAAKREGGGESAKMVAKLQGMVKDITAERDVLKTENSKVTAELETLKAQIEQNKKDKEAAISVQEKLTADLTTQKASSDEVRSRLDNTTGKLREVVEKYNALNKSKNDLAAAYATLQNNQQATSSELKACESKNVKMFEGAKEVIDGFQNCQKKGIMDTLIGSEPFTQINNVEFETIMQGYEDKLNKQKYQSKTPVKPAPSTQPPVPANNVPSTADAPAPADQSKK